MTKATNGLWIFLLMFIASCTSPQEKPEESITEEQVEEQSPEEMLKQAYQLFKEGDDETSVKLANRVLEIGKETGNDTLVGRALTSLCRNSQRKLDTTRLAELSAELSDLSAKSGNQIWLMYLQHIRHIIIDT